MEIAIRPIGVIHTQVNNKEDAPIQGAMAPDAAGAVEIHPEYEDGLQDIETFSHLMLLYQFDRASDTKLVRATFLDDNPHGVFASRHPCRPNGIGITTVRLLGRSGRMLQVAGIDVLDGTPLIDVKPYIPRFDCFPDASEGWIAGVKPRQKPQGRE